MNFGKKAFMIGAAGVILSGAVLLIEKMIREKKFENELWEVDEDDDSEIEFMMYAGDIDVEEEEEDEETALPEVEVVGVVLTGPRTARVRPTEEEEKEMLRKKLESTIRF